MMLFLDTSVPEQTFLFLLDEKGLKKIHVWPSKFTQSETLHEEIGTFLSKNKVTWPQVKKIGVVIGPGFFSRVRTGVVTANTIGYALNIPVVGIKKLGTGINFNAVVKLKGTKSVPVFYDRKPNITKSKKK
jgi:tRNA threonylcarbamoyladenosine biosynthesis protein TsaB